MPELLYCSIKMMSSNIGRVFFTTLLILNLNFCFAQIGLQCGIIPKTSSFNNLSGTAPGGLKYHNHRPSVSFLSSLEFLLKEKGIGFEVGTFYNIHKYKYTLQTEHNYDNSGGYKGLNIYKSSAYNPFINFIYAKQFQKIKLKVSVGVNSGNRDDFSVRFESESSYRSVSTNQEEIIREVRYEEQNAGSKLLGLQSQLGFEIPVLKNISISGGFIFFTRSPSSTIRDSFYFESKAYGTMFTPLQRFYGLTFSIKYNLNGHFFRRRK